MTGIKKVKRILFFLNICSTVVRILNCFIKIKRIKIGRYGKSFFVSGNLEYLWFWVFGSWERNTYKAFDKYLDPNHSYIDIGAWIGPTVLYGAQIAKKVYAIEPDPIAFKELEKNVSLNPELKNNIELHEKCINSYSGQTKFGNMIAGGNSTSSLLFADSKVSWIVEAVTMDQFVEENNITDCDFIKMDIEGGETVVLPAMKQYLEKNKPVLFISLHPLFFQHPAEDMKKIIDVLMIYKNVYDAAGKKIVLDDFLLKSEFDISFSVIATDN